MTALFRVVRGVVREEKRNCGECRWAVVVEGFEGLPTIVTCEQPDSDHYQHILQEFHPACRHFTLRVSKERRRR